MTIKMRYRSCPAGREQCFDDPAFMQALHDLERAWLDRAFGGVRLRRDTAETFAVGRALPYEESMTQYWAVVDIHTTENPTPWVEVELSDARYAEIMQMHARLIKITTPDADPIGTARDHILALGVGCQHGTTHVVVQRHQDSYRLVAVWPVMETDDEDPGSVGCGCPLQGRSHAHAERNYRLAEIDTLVVDFVAAKAAMAAGRTVVFARGARIGA